MKIVLTKDEAKKIIKAGLDANVISYDLRKEVFVSDWLETSDGSLVITLKEQPVIVTEGEA